MGDFVGSGATWSHLNEYLVEQREMSARDEGALEMERGRLSGISDAETEFADDVERGRVSGDEFD